MLRKSIKKGFQVGFLCTHKSPFYKVTMLSEEWRIMRLKNVKELWTGLEMEANHSSVVWPGAIPAQLFCRHHTSLPCLLWMFAHSLGEKALPSMSPQHHCPLKWGSPSGGGTRETCALQSVKGQWHWGGSEERALPLGNGWAHKGVWRGERTISTEYLCRHCTKLDQTTKLWFIGISNLDRICSESA